MPAMYATTDGLSNRRHDAERRVDLATRVWNGLSIKTRQKCVHNSHGNGVFVHESMRNIKGRVA